MKHRLLILIITVCVVFQLARLESYMGGETIQSTRQAEQEERVYGGEDRNANISSALEILEREDILYNAKTTDQDQKKERYYGLDNAYSTEGRQNVERNANLNDAYLTTQAQNREEKDLILNNQSTIQEEQRERIGLKNNASITERMEQEARQTSH
ncbi:MAG TPA: hypothetical protein VHX42_04810 [Candidatus Babeliales bacterium]|jgi:hypothetical protein|nr:hypothetical protein [Candidatus Babeliales bacterium]